MTAREITDKLQGINTGSDLVYFTGALVNRWESAGVGVEAVEPVLRFMEEHPDADFGVPGPLVHFVESFLGKGYEEKLIESIRRRPTAHTIGMLHRLINGTKRPDVRQSLIQVMDYACVNPSADQAAIGRAKYYLDKWQ